MSDETQELEAVQEAETEGAEAQLEMSTSSAPSEESPESETSLNRILDIPLMLSAQLGSTRMLIKELLQLGPGSVVELDKLAGEPLEVLVNDKIVARGEVVMVNEKFGIRLTSVVSPTERVNKLQ